MTGRILMRDRKEPRKEKRYGYETCDEKRF